MVSVNYAWNMQGPMVVPAPADAEQRQLEIWLTPRGCLKGALAPEANPIVITRNEQGKGRIRYYELVLTNDKDFGGGVMFPSTFHQHHDLDDDLEGEGVNVSGGHNSFGLTVSSVQVNVSGAALTVPDAVPTATIPPVRVESSQTADGVWYVGGGTHASVAVEFQDFITDIEAPLNEDRSLAAITPASRTFYDNVRRLKLDVATIAPIHGGRVYPWADFAKFVNSGKTN